MATVKAAPLKATTVGTSRYHRARAVAGKVLIYLALIVLSLFILLPTGWMLTAALKPDDATVFTRSPEWFPSEYWQWDNFWRVLTDTMPFLRYVINTTIIVVFNVFGIVISCSFAAFAFARLRFRGSELLFTILIITMLIPWQVLMIPQFLMFVKIGWYGTYLPLILPSFGGAAFYIFLIRQYMRTIPRELDEAARVDGLNTWQIFWKIILPLSTPALTVSAVFTFLASWSDLLGPLIYLDSNEKFTVALGLANMVQRQATSWNLLMAANIIAMVPPIVVYFFLQKRLIGGIASVGLKG